MCESFRLFALLRGKATSIAGLLDLTSATSSIQSGIPLTMRRPDEPAQ
jgi:hypothetical protein